MTPRTGGALKLLALAVAFAAVWTLIATIGDGSSALHHDIVEAYVWGRQFQLGYYKHPPFWAWIAGLWFLGFPEANWSAHLLAATNAAIGLVGAWRLIGCFADGPKRAAATLLLLATPFYTMMAMRFNANAIFLSLWPWTLYAFTRSLDGGRTFEAVLFGLLIGACGLSKYYACLLLLACALSLPLHPKGWSWLRSTAPWAAGAAAFLVVSPHLWWLARNHFPSFGYFAAETGRDLSFSLANVARMPVEWLAYHVVVVLAAAAAAGTGPRTWRANLDAQLADARFRFRLALLALPLALTLIAGLMLRLKLSSNWTEAVFPLAPLLVLDVVGGDMVRIRRAAAAVALAITAIALALAPASAAGLIGANGPSRTEPRREVAAEATAIWRRATRRPLRTVAGSFPFDEAVAFYSPDHPATFIDFDPRHAPWIDPRAMRRDGWLAVCVSGDQRCETQAAALSTPSTRRTVVRLAPAPGGKARRSMVFDMIVTPPVDEAAPVSR